MVLAKSWKDRITTLTHIILKVVHGTTACDIFTKDFWYNGNSLANFWRLVHSLINDNLHAVNEMMKYLQASTVALKNEK